MLNKFMSMRQAGLRRLFAVIASAASAVAVTFFIIGLGFFGDDSFCRQEQTGDACGVGECDASDFSGIEDTGFEEIAVRIVCGIIAHFLLPVIY